MISSLFASVAPLPSPGEAFVDATATLLSKLPSLPPNLLFLDFDRFPSPTFNRTGCNRGWDEHYLLPGANCKETIQPSLIVHERQDITELITSARNSQITRVLDTNSIRIALLIAGSQKCISCPGLLGRLTSYINLLVDLLEAASRLDNDITHSQINFDFDERRPGEVSKRNFEMLLPNRLVKAEFGLEDFHDDYPNTRGRAVVMGFLWTVWQRSTMLVLYWIICNQINGHWMEGPFLPRGAVVRNGGDLMYNPDRTNGAWRIPNYLCPWAFELLRTRRTLIGLDFRTLLVRFREQFEPLYPAGRCLSNPPRPCTGTSAQNCHRFQDPDVVRTDPGHFSHDLSCKRKDCVRVKWDETSYHQARSPRSVNIRSSDSEQLLIYCEGGEKTLAVSHVWRHGQGGRPEHGLNSCLHRRYSMIARENGCDSYWIDTACIPKDDTDVKKILRKEALLKINDVFGNSKMTLVCDRDIMEIEVDATPSIAQWETLFATLLVSDWNIRAWTLLEAVRGRNQLHLLTKNNRIVNVQSGMRKLCEGGAMDLVILLSAASHLLPHSHSLQGFEEVGHVLSHRHASWPRDEVRIWSLLTTGKPYTSIEELVDEVRHIKTAFLISNSPRSTTKGFRWAPATPRLSRRESGPSEQSIPTPTAVIHKHSRVLQQSDTNHMVSTATAACSQSGNALSPILAGYYHSYDGEGSSVGHVTPHGFEAKWWAWPINGRKDLETMPRAMKSATSPFTEKNGVWKKIHQLLYATGSDYTTVAFLEALSEDGTTPWNAADSREEGAQAEKGVVCASRDERTWEWHGVYEAPRREFKMDRRSITCPLGVAKTEPEPSKEGDSGWKVMNVLLI